VLAHIVEQALRRGGEDNLDIGLAAASALTGAPAAAAISRTRRVMNLRKAGFNPTAMGQTPSSQRASLPVIRAGAAKVSTNFPITWRERVPVTVTLSVEAGCAAAGRASSITTSPAPIARIPASLLQ
jgi:hypothetical protein